MKLYHSPTSPYVRKVMIVAHVTGAAPHLELIPAAGTPLAPDTGVAAVNPVGKVPCLITDDGLALHDSRVITRYLDARGGTGSGAGLYPEGDALWPVLVREATAEGILDAALSIVYEGRLRPEDKRFPDYVEAQRTRIRRALDALETEASGWQGFDAGHVAAVCALGYLDFRHPDLAWREGRPGLAAWFEDISAQRGEIAATAPPAA